MHLYYAKELPKNFYAHSLKHETIGQVIQSEFTPDSRAVVTLEEDNMSKERVVKVWYNGVIKNIKEPEIRMRFKSSKTLTQDFIVKPIPNNLDELEHIMLPSHKDKIVFIKMVPFPQSMYAREEIIPISFIVVTEKGKAFFWMEQLSYNDQDEFIPIEFICVHTFVSPYKKQDGCFDIQYLSLNISDMSSNHAEKRIDTSSRFLDSRFEDYISIAKTINHGKLYGNMFTPNYNGKTS